MQPYNRLWAAATLEAARTTHRLSELAEDDGERRTHRDRVRTLVAELFARAREGQDFPEISAAAARLRGRIDLDDDRFADARTNLSRATHLGGPVERAQTYLLLARAHEQLGDDEPAARACTQAALLLHGRGQEEGSLREALMQATRAFARLSTIMPDRRAEIRTEAERLWKLAPDHRQKLEAEFNVQGPKFNVEGTGILDRER